MNRYILPIIIVLCAIGAYEFYVQPLYGDIERSLAQEAQINAAIIQADAAQAKLDAIAKRYESFPLDADQRLSEIIPEKVDPIRLLVDTSAFFERNGFIVKSLTVGGGVDGAGAGNTDAAYQTHVINFTLPATYDNFRSFLRTLETSLALRDPVDVSFTTAAAPGTFALGRSPELAVHEYNVQITSYSLR